MIGSSARKLRHSGANLLAGRAFVYNLSRIIGEIKVMPWFDALKEYFITN